MGPTNRRRLAGLVLAGAIAAFSLSPPFRAFTNLPAEMRISMGNHHRMNPGIPLQLYARAGNQGSVRLNGRQLAQGNWQRLAGRDFDIEPISPGRVDLEFRLLGRIPLKRMVLEVVPPVKVFPSGHSVGVLLRAEGVLVVGVGAVSGIDGIERYPAREAGIEVGDTIVSANGFPIRGNEQFADLVDAAGRAGQEVTVRVKRNGTVFERRVRPVLCEKTRRYRIGLFIRDGVAGVGTMTFFDPGTRRYGALGHVIADADTNRPVEIRDGRIVLATISGVERGRRGSPGEKIGVFADGQEAVGTIDRNSDFGIFGTLTSPLDNPLFPEPIPIGLMSEVERGPAQIITVVTGRKLEMYDVEIEKVMPTVVPNGKGMVIRVTDPVLLDRTGGIVQGMSGSPIIQKGRLVGAITHVFVNDPSRGYGVFAEWMIEESGIVKASRAQIAG